MCIIAPMRKFLVLLVLFLGVVFVIFSFSELEHTVATLQQGNLWYILLAFLIQIGWFFLVGITYRSIYRLLGMTESILNLTRVAAAATFVNVVMPTAGVGGIAIFVNAAKKDGHPTGKVTLAATLFVLFDLAAFLAVLALGMIVLIRRNDLNGRRCHGFIDTAFHCIVIGFHPLSRLPLGRIDGKLPGTDGASGQCNSSAIYPPGLPARRTRT